MKKLKSLILTMCFMMIVGSSNIYATNRSIEYATTTSGTSSPHTASGKTELDGKIGEWDPNDSEKPDFDGIGSSDIEGTIPGNDDYFTISVTVPTNMEFMVLPNSQDYRGSFFSPEYTIKNNGSKNITVKAKTMTRDSNTVIDSNIAPLYVGKRVQGDNEMQIELMLTAIDGWDKKNIRLYDMGSLNEDEKILYNLGENETKKVKFYAKNWDLLKYEVKQEEAKSNFSLSLEFSVATPSTTTP